MIDKIDINDRTKTPCKTEGCDWPNYHVCLVGKEDLVPTLLRQENGRWKKGRKRPPPRSDDHLNNLKMSARERWDAYRESNRERDEKIVKRYGQGGISIRGLELEFQMSRNAVRAVLHRAVENQQIVMRPTGVTVANDKHLSKVAN